MSAALRQLTLALSGAGAEAGTFSVCLSARPPSGCLLFRAEAGRLSLRSVPEERPAATRVWAARESLKKAGALDDAPLLLVSSEADGWVLLSSGSLRIATWETEVRDVAGKLIVAVLLRDE